MHAYSIPVHVRWSDLDPNFHVRHSVYYDFGAQCRMAFLNEHGLTAKVMGQHHFGPVLFREEAIFKRELHHGQDLRITVACSALKSDYSRFSMQHEIIRGDDEVCARLHVDGAWIDTQKRKLTVPPQLGVDMMEKMPKAKDFRWIS